MSRSTKPYDPDHYVSKLRAPRRVGIDLDGTLSEPVWEYSYGIGKPIKKNIRKVQELIKAGHKIYIYTARPDYDVEAIERWCRDHGILIKGVVTGKPLWNFFVDDKAIPAHARSWLPK